MELFHTHIEGPGDAQPTSFVGVGTSPQATFIGIEFYEGHASSCLLTNFFGFVAHNATISWTATNTQDLLLIAHATKRS